MSPSEALNALLKRFDELIAVGESIVHGIRTVTKDGDVTGEAAWCGLDLTYEDEEFADNDEASAWYREAIAFLNELLPDGHVDRPTIQTLADGYAYPSSAKEVLSLLKAHRRHLAARQSYVRPAPPQDRRRIGF